MHRLTQCICLPVLLLQHIRVVLVSTVVVFHFPLSLVKWPRAAHNSCIQPTSSNAQMIYSKWRYCVVLAATLSVVAAATGEADKCGEEGFPTVPPAASRPDATPPTPCLLCPAPAVYNITQLPSCFSLVRVV